MKKACLIHFNHLKTFQSLHNRVVVRTECFEQTANAIPFQSRNHSYEMLLSKTFKRYQISSRAYAMTCEERKQKALFQTEYSVTWTFMTRNMIFDDWVNLSYHCSYHTLRAGLKLMQPHWALRLCGPRAMVLRQIIHFCQIHLAVENSVGTA